jgi:type II secretory pathway component PulJ
VTLARKICSRRGFSILEALTATFLAGIFLVVLSDLTSSLRKISTDSEEKESSLAVRDALFSSLRMDLSSAVEVVNPNGPSETSTCDLSRLKPESLIPSSLAKSRLPATLPTSGGYTWNPTAKADCDQVVYDSSGGFLRRKLGTNAALPLVEVRSFRCSQPQTGLFRVTIERQIRTRVETLVCVVSRA